MKNTKTNHHQTSGSKLSPSQVSGIKATDKKVDKQKLTTEHLPVLVDRVLEYLDPKEGDSFLDLTAGYGGHSAAVIGRTLAHQRVTLVDRDRQAIEQLKKRFDKPGINIIHQDYLSASRQLRDRAERFDLILVDLGVSSPHFDNASRGFSLKLDGPLDMRMDPRQKLTAYDIVNNYSQAELAKLLRDLGEEPKAHRVAQLIVENRPIQSTLRLANVIARAWPGPAHKIHPATRSFQAIRLAVNDELHQLSASLPIWLELLAPGGRIVIISFHSLEDRIVKNFLKEYSGNRYDAILKLLTPKPVTADKAELAFNPRARSAKLRAAVKIKTKRLVA